MWAALALAACEQTGGVLPDSGRAPDAGPDAGGDDGGLDGGLAITPPFLPAAVLASLVTGDAAAQLLCANDFRHPNFPYDADLFIQVFCGPYLDGGAMPVPHSLSELQSMLGLGFTDSSGQNGVGGNPAFALSGHSTAIGTRFVSAINPHAIVFSPLLPDGGTPADYVSVAFVRGGEFAEVAARDPTLGTLVLYLVRFTLACDGSDAGCGFADLLTPAVESGWQSVTSYTASTQINDTVLDCLQCHQPQGTPGPTILRMQENSAPYTHFFSSRTPGGTALLGDFHAAHGQAEGYGGIPGTLIGQSDPALLAQFVAAAGFGAQPNAFPSAAIEAEVEQSAPGQPAVNVPMGTSATWETIYGVSQAGDAIPAPYHDVKITDPAKLAAASQLYQSVEAGQTPPDALTDIRAVFLDQGVRDMGFAPAAGLDGKGLLAASCQHCHNSQLDQTISRARFNVENLSLLPREVKQEATRRLGITDLNDPEMMPPPLFHTLTADERQLIISVLGQ